VDIPAFQLCDITFLHVLVSQQICFCVYTKQNNKLCYKLLDYIDAAICCFLSSLQTDTVEAIVEVFPYLS
jgi:hypothetical protein